MLNNITNDTARYTKVAMILHWILAIAFILMIASGLAFDGVPMSQELKFNMFQWHKSLGLLILVTVGVRILWRLFHKPPVLPASFKKLDIIGAKFGHFALYAAMIIMPLSGWIMISSSSTGLPTYIFGLFEWPHIPDLVGNKALNHNAKEIHETVAWIFIGLIGVHIAAIIKHIAIDKVNIMPRMMPCSSKCKKDK